MRNIKRLIYGLPFLRRYRVHRAKSALGPARKVPEGFVMQAMPIMLEPSWEREERQVMSDLVPQASALIDIGANHGFYTLLAAHAGKRVVAVEPDAGNLAVLRSNIALNRADVEVHAVALSESRGKTWFYGDGDMASLLQEWQGVGRFFRQQVTTMRLDDVIDGRWPGERLLIKIDVEGAEDMVLAGARDTIARDPKPFWLIETFPRLPTGGPCPAFHTVFDTMWAAGYEACLVTDPSRKLTNADILEWAREPELSSNFLFSEPVGDPINQ